MKLLVETVVCGGCQSLATVGSADEGTFVFYCRKCNRALVWPVSKQPAKGKGVDA